jgi:large subunit ribosomal protein L3
MVRSGIIAKKMGMTTLFLDSGEACAVTILSLEGCCVVMKKSGSLQVGSGKNRVCTKPMRGHFARASIEPKKILREFRVSSEASLEEGTVFSADYFPEGHFVDVTGVTVGRGFAGAMKRWNFKGLRASHGVSVAHRSHGSTGHRKDPAKVFKGKKMAGHLGCEQVTLQNLKVLKFDVERGLILVKGSIPGSDGSWVQVRDAIKKTAKQSIDPLLGVVSAAS